MEKKGITKYTIKIGNIVNNEIITLLVLLGESELIAPKPQKFLINT